MKKFIISLVFKKEVQSGSSISNCVMVVTGDSEGEAFGVCYYEAMKDEKYKGHSLLFYSSIELEDTEKKVYVLFGEDICNTYENDGIEEALEEFAEMGGSVKMYDIKENPLKVIEDTLGWNKHIEIPEEHYRMFLSKNKKL